MENELLFHLERICLLLGDKLNKDVQRSINRILDEKIKGLINDSNSDRLINTTELEALLGISKSHINKLKSNGLPYYKLGDSIRFIKWEVLDFIKKYKRKGGEETQ